MKESYMLQAIALAKKGYGRVNPNPLVGAVIVKNDHIIGEGYHEAYGGYHAERNALKNCTQDPAGATMYVTLEPCCHHGKTPPCTQAILDAGIATVVVGCKDPNPKVGGNGIRILQEHGVHVIEDVEEEACRELNKIFFHYIQKDTPFVAMKFAMTVDGKIATVSGESQWISGEESRQHVHLLRNRYQAIMVGIGTVLADDPLLTCRIPNGRNPIRIICDTHLRIPLSSKIVTTANEIPTIIATCSEDRQAIAQLEHVGCQVISFEKQQEHVDLVRLFQTLRNMEIDSVLIEGGSTLHYSVLESGYLQKVYAYVGAKLLGGEKAKTPIGGTGIAKIAQALPLHAPHVTTFGDDLLLEYTVR